MLYDFVPMPERKPLKWPNGKRLALMITLNLEYWELTQDHDGPYFPGGPSINERLLPARIPDFNNHSWREYGHGSASGGSTTSSTKPGCRQAAPSTASCASAIRRSSPLRRSAAGS